MNDGSMIMMVYMMGMAVHILIDTIVARMERRGLNVKEAIALSFLWPIGFFVFLYVLIGSYVKDLKK
jgi:predicted PurR-regulated permease PerM